MSRKFRSKNKDLIKLKVVTPNDVWTTTNTWYFTKKITATYWVAVGGLITTHRLEEAVRTLQGIFLI